MTERESTKFLDNLSISLLQICAARALSYEKAVGKYSYYSRHFSNIIWRRAFPTLRIFEQIYIDFQETPNHLLGVVSEEHSFRAPMPVTEVQMVSSGVGAALFPTRPQCGRNIEREFQFYCDRCGQCSPGSNLALPA